MELEMTGAYPIILDGEKTGEIKVSRDGLFWRFEARNEMREEILRLSVYGDGLEGYLGVMEPCGEGLTLTKKLSRSALSDFPKSISFGGRKGQQVLPPPEDETADAPGTAVTCVSCEDESISPQVTENCSSCTDAAPPDENKPPPLVTVSPPKNQAASSWAPCACPCSLFSGVEAKNIGSTIHGALISETTDGILLAIPRPIAEGLPKTNYLEFMENKEIYGFDYRVYKV